MTPLCLLALTLLLPARAQDTPPGVRTPAPPADAPADELPPLLKDPQLVNFVQAPYPAEAKAQGVEGNVLLLLDVDETGKVTEVEVETPAGNGFDEAAVGAAWQFQFSPAEDETGPVPVQIEFNYGFVLDAAEHQGALPDANASEAPPETAEAPINLETQLVEMGTRRPLAGFPVHVTFGSDPSGPGLDAVSDAQGQFSFRGVPLGPVTVSTVYTGFDRATKDVEITAGEVVSLKLWVRNQSYRDDELIGVIQKDKEDVTRRTLTVAEIRRIPGTFGDPVRVIQSLPGAARTPFGTGLLVIRGANPEDSAVYIDGIRVPLIYHLGGFESVLNPELVTAVDYLPGGYPVQYGRTLGGVVDVRTKDTYSDGVRAIWKTDLLDSSAFVEGTAGKAKKWGFAAGARRSYIDFILPYFLKDTTTTIKPRWYDYQLKVQKLGMDKGNFSVFLFGFQDTLEAHSPGNQSTDQDTQGDLGTAYSTHRVLLKWERPLSDHLSLRVIPSIGLDGTNFKLGNDFRLKQNVLLGEVRGELDWSPNEAFSLRPGVDFLGGYYTFQVQLPFNPELIAEFDPLSEREAWGQEGQGTGWGPDFYLDTTIRPLANRDKLILKPGLRLDAVTVLGQFGGTSLDPRFSARWQAVKNGTAKLGLGLYNQPPQPWESWRPGGNIALDFERAWSAELGWEQQVTPALQADVTVFGKYLDQMIVPNPSLSSLDDAFFVNDGLGRIYGTEILIRHALVDKFFGWVSYTLSRSERNDYPELSEDEGGGWYIYDVDQTHILTLVGGYRLPYDLEVSAKFQFVSGNPYTPYAGGVYDVDQDFYFGYSAADRNTERLPPYISGDVRVEKLFTFKAWQLDVFVDFLNAVRGVNPEFEVYNYDYTQSRYIRGLPFIPSPGFQAEFHF